MIRISSVIFAASCLVGQLLAHPGHDHHKELRQRAAFLSSPQYRSLDHCVEAIKARDHVLIERRREIVEKLREQRSIEKRSFESVLATNHKSNKAVAPESSYLDVFGTNNSCVLQPETTEGPYCTPLIPGKPS
jgi:hypothetical protein